MAVNANRLFSAQEHVETWREAAPRSRVDMSDAGRGGSSGAIHFPLLQQKDAVSPCSKSAWHEEHVLFQTGAVHRVRHMSQWKFSHHASGPTGLAFGTV